MASRHDAKRAAKKHAKEKKRKATLARRSTAAADTRTLGSPTRRAPPVAEDAELHALLDEVDLARLDPARRAEAFRLLLELDGLLAAPGGVERFHASHVMADLARLWLSLDVGRQAGDPVEEAIAAILRVLPAIPPDDLETQVALALEPLLFRVGRGDEALDRILLRPDLSEDDLDNATSAVLDSEFATHEHMLRVRATCAAWVPGGGEGSLRDCCIEALDEGLARVPPAARP